MESDRNSRYNSLNKDATNQFLAVELRTKIDVMGFGEIMWGLKFKGFLGSIISMCILSSCSGGDKYHGARGSLPEQELMNYDKTAPAIDIFTAKCVNAAQNAYRPYGLSMSSIVNGQKVQPTESGSELAVMLLIKDEKNNISTCSSTLINDTTLITAAHCVDSAQQIMAVFYTNVSCESGFDRLSHSVNGILAVPHPDYKNDSTIKSNADYNPDLALVFLEKQAPNTYPRFVIAQSPEKLKSDLYLYGFGKTASSDVSTMGHITLRKTKVAQANYQFVEGNLVIDQKDKTGICNGDSGGGALMLNQNNKFVLAAVNSLVFSFDKEIKDLCNDSSMLVALDRYKPWIEDTIRQQTK